MNIAPEILSHTQRRAERLSFVLALFALLLAPFDLLADKAVVPLVIAAALGGALVHGVPALPWRVIDRGLLPACP